MFTGVGVTEFCVNNEIVRPPVLRVLLPQSFCRRGGPEILSLGKGRRRLKISDGREEPSLISGGRSSGFLSLQRERRRKRDREGKWRRG